jgi:hypothetical protein
MQWEFSPVDAVQGCKRKQLSFSLSETSTCVNAFQPSPVPRQASTARLGQYQETITR